MSLTAKLVACIGRLLGGKVTLLPFSNLEERVGSGFGLATHRTNIQGICISVQSHFAGQSNCKTARRLDNSPRPKSKRASPFYLHFSCTTVQALDFHGAGEGNRTLVSGLGSPHS